MTAWGLSLMIVFTMFVFAVPESDADEVTDTLTIKVGYWGMDESEYVPKVTYHWTELDDAYGGALSTDYRAYSYFRDAEDNRYSTVIVTARGFYLADLLGYAGINMSDIRNISFYTKDHKNGAFTSFTYEQLLGEPRYYFNDLPSHIKNKYNKAGILTGYEVDDSVWDDKERVDTMLALESKWSTYDAGSENSEPNYDDMSASTRFRLVFGQTDPTEVRTNQSAKYVHTIAITIPGTPQIKEDGSTGGLPGGLGNIELSKEIGMHTVKFDVATDEAMIDDIIDQLDWSSSDETVLKIHSKEMYQSEKYNDAVTVVINYEVLKVGEASISGSYHGLALGGQSVGMPKLTDEEKQKAREAEEADKNNDKGTSERSGDNEKNKSGSNTSGENRESQSKQNGNDRLSLVESGGSVKSKSNRSEQLTASKKDDTSKLVNMDLDELFETEEKPGTIIDDDAGQYMPFVCSGLGGILILGGATAALQFRAQMGGMQIQLRRR